jgi:glycosyltransferase involved in cell wall biosynthesis
MTNRRDRPGILVVAPGLDAQGGIATVVKNYSRSSFWTEYRCAAFASTTDRASKWGKFLNDISRWLTFCSTVFPRQRRPDAASIHVSHGTSFYRKFAYVIACRLVRIPVVLHIHPAYFVRFYEDGHAFRRWMIRLVGRVSDQVVVLTDAIRSELEGAFPAKTIRVLSNPVDVSIYNPPGAFERASHPRILFLGWIIPEKGVYDLVKAIPSVLRDIPDALFTFAGNKEVEKLKQTLAKADLSHSSEVLGWVDGSRKIELLKTSSVLVLPSYTEGLPNVILEAMASKLPIITTPVGGIPNVLKHEVTALFVTPGDTNAIAASILRLLRDDHFARTLATSAFSDVCENYSLDVIDHGLRNIYAKYLHP